MKIIIKNIDFLFPFYFIWMIVLVKPQSTPRTKDLISPSLYQCWCFKLYKVGLLNLEYLCNFFNILQTSYFPPFFCSFFYALTLWLFELGIQVWWVLFQCAKLEVGILNVYPTFSDSWIGYFTTLFSFFLPKKNLFVEVRIQA